MTEAVLIAFPAVRLLLPFVLWLLIQVSIDYISHKPLGESPYVSALGVDPM